jgi:demethylmenaquinone methyltransferase/2-methoxy-6-polyprenyl-1,4-benzoquinol methylase
MNAIEGERPDPKEALEKYSGLAPTYDRLTRRSAPMRRLAVKRLDLQPGQTVLDIGCGTGLTFSLLEKQIGPEGRLVGVDLSGDMLALARARVEAHDWSNVTLIEASAEEAEIPFPVDAVISVLTHDVMRSRPALENIVRHTKPGGRIAVTGAKWAPRWALPVNAYVRYIARQYVTTFEGFDRPWSLLKELVPNLEVRPILLGGAYVAWGTLPA